MDYYIGLIKKNQPSFDEMIDILIKYEKSKRELNKINLIDGNQKVNEMIENSKTRNNTQFDKIDKELLSSVQLNNKNLTKGEDHK